MPDTDTDELLATVGDLSGDAQPDTQPVVDEGGEGTSGDPVKDTSAEDLKADLDKAQKRYDDLRSHNDKVSNEMREEMGGLKAQLAQAIEATKVKPVPVSPFDQEKFDEKWRERLSEAMPGVDPETVMAFQRGATGEAMTYFDQALNQVRSEYQEELQRVRAELSDPLVRDHGQEIAGIAKKYGVTGDTAKSIFADQQAASEKAKENGATQPEVKRPGTVLDGGKAGAGGGGKVKLDLDDQNVQISLRLLTDMGNTTEEAVKILTA